MAKLIVNGQQRDYPQSLPARLTDLLQELAIAQATVVAEIDGQIIPRDAFADTPLTDGQKIELIRIVGGG